ncbi:MAG: hypothetical protein ACRD4Y_02855 [Candidatus Acidiferrales bacterium]
MDPRAVGPLLDQSGALFLRYFSHVYETPTQFWYTACDHYCFEKLHHKVRSQIRRAYRDCRVERVDPHWMGENGYSCVAAAVSRYPRALHDSEKEFQTKCYASEGGPFDYWGAFIGDRLVGFSKCVVGTNYAACVIFKLDPNYLAYSPASALQDSMLQAYVMRQHKTVFNGFRPIVHSTNMHEFLLKFGYRRVYCDLNLAYRPSVRILVSGLYRFREMFAGMSEIGWTGRIKTLLAQEEIRRSFLQART